MTKGPKGSKQTRVRQAMHWYWTTDMTQQEIGDKLGVTKAKVNEYIHESPTSPEVKRQLANLEASVRHIAVEELRQQLRTVGEKSRSAEAPVKIWQDEDGNLQIRDVMNDYGEVVTREAIPVDIEILPDEEARYLARKEIREIVDMLVDITGAAEPDSLEISGEGGGALNVVVQRDEYTEDDDEDDELPDMSWKDDYE